MSGKIKCEIEENNNETKNNPLNKFTKATNFKKSSKSTKKLIYECGDCSTQFPNKETLINHVKTSHLQTEKKFFCNLCPRSFIRKCHLGRHVSRLHPTQTLTCEFCQACFKCKENLYRHIKSLHLNDKNFQCGICQKFFKEMCYVKIHILAVHLKEKQEKCTICNKVFGTKSDKDKHVKFVHKKVKEFQCLLCKNAFALRSTIEKHIRRHFVRQGIFPYSKKNIDELIVKMKSNGEENDSDS